MIRGRPWVRLRFLTGLSLALVIGAGLSARAQRSGADTGTVAGYIATYGGDTLWPVMFFLIGRFVLPAANRGAIVAGTLALTLLIEFGQLWQPPVLQWLRAQPVIGFLLGNSFLWSDVVCIVVGSVLVLPLDVALVRLGQGSAQASTASYAS